jgi:DNA mismatch repair protein MSH6
MKIMSNTLFNYFKKSTNIKTEVKTNENLNLNQIENQIVKNHETIDILNESFSPLKKDTTKKRVVKSNNSANKKRRIMIISDSDSEKENENEKCVNDHSPIKKKQDLESENEVDGQILMQEKNGLKSTNNIETKEVLQSSKRSKIKESLHSPQKTSSSSSVLIQIDQDNLNNDLDVKWDHLKYSWLEEDKIKDFHGRRKNDPNYDSKTLHVPDSFKKDLTPGLRQWWDIKSKNFDVIIFFKVGKFYELYHVSVP